MVNGANIGDSGTGMHLTIAILAALVQRAKTGRGQLVEVAMQEAVLNLTRVKYTGTLATGKPLGRSGNRSATGGYSDLIRCKGGGSNDAVYLIVPPDNPEMFQTAMDVIGRPELKEDERFKSAPARARHSAALTEIIESWTTQREKHEVMTAFAGRGIPCGAVLDTSEVLADPHLRERGTVFDLDHPIRGRLSMIGCPVRLSDSPIAARRAPLYGEHSEETLQALAGYSPRETAALRDKGVISVPRK
jgi:formyl-CoA transferase